MRLTKLKLVQDTLSLLDLDEVTVLGETQESEQVGYIVDQIYDDLNGDYPWPHLREVGTLNITSVANEFQITDGVLTLNDIWYNGNKLTYKFPTDMLELLIDRDITLSNVDAVGAYNDQDPVYWSSYDDTVIILDGYDGNLVSALSKTDQYRMPIQMIQATDYPDLPERFHQTLFQGVVADAFYTLKGDTIGFNIWRNRYKQNKAIMKRWAKRVNRHKKTGEAVDYGRK